jgi:hypothetical protein
MKTEEAKAQWEAFAWPDWVTTELRQTIAQDFWGSRHDGPEEWLRSADRNHAPTFGARVAINSRDWVCYPSDPDAVLIGRFVYCWNNIGRIVDAKGAVHFCSFSRGAKPEATPQKLEPRRKTKRC